jgi:hypothetical protein
MVPIAALMHKPVGVRLRNLPRTSTVPVHPFGWGVLA